MRERLEKYFDGDILASDVWQNKYRFKDEVTPDDMFNRHVTETSRIEMNLLIGLSNEPSIDARLDLLSDYGKERYSNLLNGLSTSTIFNHHKQFIHFGASIFGGSMLQAIGNHKLYSSLSNCFVVESPYDSYAGIDKTANHLVQLMKRRGGCIEENTIVIIRGKGHIKIKDVQIGDEILSFNIITKQDEWKLVNDKYFTDVVLSDQIELRYSNGTKLKSSKKHPVLNLKESGYGFDNFNSGILQESFNKAPNKNNYLFNQNFDESLANIGWWIGAHCGDGCADIVLSENETKSGRVRIKKSDKEVVDTYQQIHQELSGSNTKVVKSSDTRYDVDVWQYEARNIETLNVFEKYLDNQINSKTLTIKIPEFVKTNNLYIPFIAGLIDTDGFVLETGRIDIEICGKNLIKELSEYLSLNGECFSVVEKTMNKRERFNVESQVYRLHIYSNSKSYLEIAKYLVNPKRKQNIKTNSTLQSNVIQLTADEQAKINNFKQLNIGNKADRSLFSANKKNMNKRNGLLAISAIKLCKYYNCFSSDEYNEIISRTKLDSIIEDNQTKQVYIDISVEGNNNYYAGEFGFVNIHNCGSEVSTIRPKSSRVNNQALTSSGPMPFLERYSMVTKEVAQDGRRGALMLSMSIKHPDVLEFILSKIDRSKLTGANISVKLDEEFMQAVEADAEFLLRFPVNSDISRINPDSLELNKFYEFDNVGANEPTCLKKVSALEYWNAIITAAHDCAEPGLLFEGNWEKGGTDWIYPQYRPVSTNPCSEIPMQPYDACRLIALNVYGLVENPFTDSAYINFDKAKQYFYEQMVIADLSITMEMQYVQRIIDKIYKSNDPEDLKLSEITLWTKIRDMAQRGRRCGAGFTGLGDMLAAVGCDYYSPRVIERLFKIKMEAELNATIDMSILYGSFDGFDAELEQKSIYNQNVISAEFPELYAKMLMFGRRNVSWSTAAPNGSTSMLTQTTSGIEPVFKAFYVRRKKCTQPSDRVDYTDPADGQQFTEYFVLHHKFKTYLQSAHKLTLEQINDMSVSEITKFFEASPYYNNTAEDLHWKQRIEVQAIVQRYTTHAISSTINLPEDIDKETVGNIYLHSWKSGLKGNTVYREGSRGGILVDVNSGSGVQKVATENSLPTIAVKRPIVLPGHYYTLNVGKKRYSVMLGLVDNMPFEIFIASGLHNLPEVLDESQHIEGEIVKDTKDWYNFVCDDFILREISDMENEEKLVSLMISGLFAHRTPLKKVIKIIEKSKPFAGSFSHKLVKILSKYLVQADIKGELCPQCNAQLKHENGCISCPECGWSKC